MNGTFSTSWLPLLAIAVPILGGIVVFRGARWERWAAGFLVVAVCSATTLSICAFMAHQASKGNQIDLSLLQLVPPVHIALRVDAMGALFAMTVAALFALAQVHAIGYMSNDRRQWAFHGFLLASLGCMIGVALAANLVTLLLFYELFSLLAYPLIVHERTPAAFRAGRKYLIYILSGGALIFSGIVLVYWLAGSVDFLPGGVLPATAPHAALLTAWWLLLAGFGPVFLQEMLRATRKLNRSVQFAFSGT